MALCDASGGSRPLHHMPTSDTPKQFDFPKHRQNIASLQEAQNENCSTFSLSGFILSMLVLATVTAMVVDDEAVSRAALSKLLANMGFGAIETADGGEDALKNLTIMGNTHGIQPDIMFVDIRMPVMNGPDLMRAMVERDVDCIIVLVSGLDQETCDIAAQLARMRGVHLAGVIAKPVTKSELSELLSTLR